MLYEMNRAFKSIINDHITSNFKITDISDIEFTPSILNILKLLMGFYGIILKLQNI